MVTNRFVARRGPGRRPTGGAWVLLALLPALVALQCRGESPAPSAGAAGPFVPETGLASLAPDGFAASGPVRELDEDSLHEKHGMKDGFYFDAGFRRAFCQDFEATAGAGAGFEACVYELRGWRAAVSTALAIRQADAVFGRPASGPSAALGHAWEAPGFLAFAQGEAYVELLSADATPAGAGPLRAVATALSARLGGAVAPPPPFPEEGRRAGGLRLVVRNAFGMQGLEGLYTADYAEPGGRQAVAFWSERDSTEDAAAVAGRWQAFLEANGARPAPSPVEGAVAFELLGFIEIVCVRGAIVAGVHQAEDVALARRLATALCAPGGP